MPTRKHKFGRGYADRVLDNLAHTNNFITLFSRRYRSKIKISSNFPLERETMEEEHIPLTLQHPYRWEDKVDSPFPIMPRQRRMSWKFKKKKVDTRIIQAETLWWAQFKKEIDTKLKKEDKVNVKTWEEKHIISKHSMHDLLLKTQ
jgi:hypothetical protein